MPLAGAGAGAYALWFVETAANQVGKITTAAIAPGSDGNLWFTESGLNDINRMTTAGAVTGTFSVPTSPGVPFGIAPGPDKNLWFTEYQGNKVTQITTAGAMTESPVPTAKSKPFGITPGLDGNVWFAPGPRSPRRRASRSTSRWSAPARRRSCPGERESPA